jgi:rSAM/selenodomain-associated transferase 2/rSAM/selenodomain-associated transferase 1
MSAAPGRPKPACTEGEPRRVPLHAAPGRPKPTRTEGEAEAPTRFLRIVVPVLNEGPALAARLAALQPLRARGAEVVVVDGGSTDESWRIAGLHADAVLLAPRGRAAQMQAGAAAARAQVLLFLHADTALPPDADGLVARAIAAGARWGRFDVRIDSRAPLLRLVSAMINLRSRWTGVATGDQAIFVQRALFEQVGGFADIALMEDVALCKLLRRHGPPACLRERVTTSARRWEQHGMLRTVVLMWALRARYALGADPSALAARYGYVRRPAPAQAGIAVMAKAPVAGLAKTRLAPTIGAAAAARLQRRFTLDTVHTAQAAALGPVRLWCAPDAGHRFFRALAQTHGVALLPQAGGDLGARLQAAVAQHFAQASPLPLLIVGTDCPVLSPGHLQAAARALEQHDAVAIPALDGGYVLLGLRRPLAGVFDGIAWSTDQVMTQTRERLRAAGARWHELAPLWDVDEAEDWWRYQALRHPHPRTQQEPDA